MRITKLVTFSIVLLLGVAAWAQEFPKYELAMNYDYMRFNPSSNVNSHSLNGGGGSITFNINDYVGIKADLQGTGSNSTEFHIPASLNFPTGAFGTVQGNLFTYMIGPQVKVRTHKFQPYGHVLLGGAHTNVYSQAFSTFCRPTLGACSFSKGPTAEAFALEPGIGFDIPVNHMIQIRPAEVNYLMTRFSNPFTGANNQHNFVYSAGIVFTFGHSQH